MAKVAAQTGISPLELELLDADVWSALVDAVDTKWGQVEEMLTFQAELLHELIRVTLGIHGNRMTQPLRLPRPDQMLEQQPSTPAEQMAQIAAQFGGVVVHHG